MNPKKLVLIFIGCILLYQPLSARELDVDVVLRVIELTNEARSANGLSRLNAEKTLRQAAQAHAVDQANRGYLAHVTPEGVTVTDRVKKAGYSGLGGWENLYKARGNNYETPEAAVEAWMKSPGHRKNILDRRINQIGVGLANDSEGRYIYVQNFGQIR